MATSQRTWQPENQEPNHGNTRVLRYSLCKLISAIVSHLNLTSEQRMESLTTRQPTEESKQLWKTLNWEYPGGAEYTCITRTLEKQKELLQHMYRQGEDTSQKELLVQLLRKIWKYIQLSKFTRMGLSSSLHHQDEWKLFVLPNKGDESDTFQQQVEKLLSFLKNEMAEYDTQVLDHSRYLKVVGSRAEDAALSLLIPLPSSCHAHPYKKLWKNLAINSHSCLPL